MSEILTRKAASDYLKSRWGFRCSPSTLAKFASEGGGPLYRKAGRTPVYEIEHLEAWALSRISKPVAMARELGEAA